MSKRVLTFTLFCFFTWILPLGIFIKPSQEKLACGGQRAICLCSHLIGKTAAKGHKYQASGSVQKEETTSSTSHYFMMVSKEKDAHRPFFRHFEDEQFRYSLLIDRRQKQVPKA